MATPKKKRRVNSSEFTDRILVLQSIYGKDTAAKLGISKSTLSKYKNGSNPKQENYEKINKTFTNNKKQIDPQKYEQVKQRHEKALNAERHTDVYEYIDWLENHPVLLADKNHDVNVEIDDVDRLIDIAEQGYIVAYRHSMEHIQFILHGTHLEDADNKDGDLYAIVLTGHYGKGGRKSAGYMPKQVEIIGIPESVRKVALHLSPADSFETITNKLQTFLMTYGQQYVTGRTFFYGFLGFYFGE